MSVTLEAYQAELETWVGTPYVPGQQKKGSGIDCIRFVFSMLDWLYEFENPTKCPRLPSQVGMNNKPLAMTGLKAAFKAYKPEVLWNNINPTRLMPEYPEPGDVMIIRRGDNSPAHSLIAGTRRNILWHCDYARGMDGNGGVMETSYGFAQQLGIMRIWRPRINWRTECLIEQDSTAMAS